jgi:phosphate regulon transcriptional regulator PhoB
LVVDDEETILELIAYNLQKEGFQAEKAVDGWEALEKVAANPPDLLVLDWMLPGVDGLEVCRRLRDNPETRNLPIIMLTARGEEVDKVLGLELGANDYVTKPFSPRELLARIKAHLRVRQAQSLPKAETGETVIRQGGLRLDAEKYQVIKNDRSLELPPKEFELLFLLASHPGKIFRREEILNRIWGYDYPADTRTVDVHIRYLRQKIEDDPNNPDLLLTVRGVGYRFREQKM